MKTKEEFFRGRDKVRRFGFRSDLTLAERIECQSLMTEMKQYISVYGDPDRDPQQGEVMVEVGESSDCETAEENNNEESTDG